MRRAVLALVLLSVPSGCQSEPEVSSYFDMDFFGTPFAGTEVDCKQNTSYPDSDARAGKYFVNARGDGSTAFSMIVHFMAHESAPPDGTYDVASELSLDASFLNTSGGTTGDTMTSGTVDVATEDGGLSLEVDALGESTDLTGTVFCAISE